MACCQLNGCCCCCSLQTGTKVIGFLALLGSVLTIITYVQQISANSDITGILVVSIIGIILIAANIVCLILLLTAAFKNSKPKRLFPWIIVFGIASIYRIVAYTATGVILINNNTEAGLGIALIVTGFIVAAFDLYLWLVVYSYYRVLKSGPN